MKILTIDENNIDQEHICCAIGNDKQNQSRAQSKKAWMKERFKDGLVFKRFDQRGKMFIEYMPIEKAWKPILLNTGQFTVDIDRYGVFCHFYDTIPPKIEKTNILQNSILPNQNEITFVVTDNSGTLLNYNAYINGEWALMIYDLKYYLFTIPFKYSQRKNIKSLKVPSLINPSFSAKRKEYLFSESQ